MAEELKDLSIESIEGDAEVGGWQANLGFMNDQSQAEYGRRGKITFLMEGAGVFSSPKSVGLVGSIFPRQVTYDKRQSRSEVILGTTHLYMEQAGLQGLYFSDQAVPANPHQMVDLSLAKIVQHIVEQHTNISSTAFIQESDGSYSAVLRGGWVDTTGINTADSTTVDVYSVKETRSMWTAIKAIAANEMGVVYFTKNDELIYQYHPMFAPVLPDVTLDITQNMVIDQPLLKFNEEAKPDQVQLYAFQDPGEELKSFYPEEMGAEGRRHRISNMRCNTQARLDVLSARLYNQLHRDWIVVLKLPGAIGSLLELFDRVSFTYTGTAQNGVDIDWDEKKFWVSKIRVSRVHNFGAITELSLEEEHVIVEE